jgi:hypothetical protein
MLGVQHDTASLVQLWRMTVGRTAAEVTCNSRGLNLCRHQHTQQRMQQVMQAGVSLQLLRSCAD